MHFTCARENDITLLDDLTQATCYCSLAIPRLVLGSREHTLIVRRQSIKVLVRSLSGAALAKRPVGYKSYVPVRKNFNSVFKG
jgi:hypothetical protein